MSVTMFSAYRESTLTLADYAAYCRLPAAWLTETFGVMDDPRGGISLPFGYGCPTLTRRHLKRRQGADAYSHDDDKFSWPKGSHIKHLLYGVGQAGMPNDIILVEGPSDVHVLTWLGFPAVGLPAAKVFGHPDQLQLLSRHQRVLVVHEPGNAGGRPVRRPQPPDRVRPARLPGTARPADRGLPDPRGLSGYLPGPGRVRDQPDRDGRQHRDLPRQPVPPVRGPTGRRRAPARGGRRPARASARRSSRAGRTERRARPALRTRWGRRPHPNGLGYALGDARLLGAGPVRRRRDGRRADRGEGRPRRGRLLERRRHRRPRPSRAHPPPGRRDPDRRAPPRPRTASRRRASGSAPSPPRSGAPRRSRSGRSRSSEGVRTGSDPAAEATDGGDLCWRQPGPGSGP